MDFREFAMDRRLSRKIASLECAALDLAVVNDAAEKAVVSMRQLGDALRRFDASLTCAALDEIERLEQAETDHPLSDV